MLGFGVRGRETFRLNGCCALLSAVPAFDLPMIDQSNLLLAWANDSSTLVLAFEVCFPNKFSRQT
jgi:hypothetical protein